MATHPCRMEGCLGEQGDGPGWGCRAWEAGGGVVGHVGDLEPPGSEASWSLGQAGQRHAGDGAGTGA